MSTASSSPGDPPHPEDFELVLKLSQFLSPDQAQHSRNTPSPSPTTPHDGTSTGAVVPEASPLVNAVPDWREPCPLPTDKLGYILERQIWHDVKFIVGDPSSSLEEISAHKLILGMSSAVFEAMLFGPLSNSQEEAIQIPDVDPTAFSLLLKVSHLKQLNIYLRKNIGN